MGSGVGPAHADGGSWVTTRNYEDRPAGELWLLAGNGEEQLVDDDVLVDLGRFNRNRSLPRQRRGPTRLEKDWFYFVLDETGERHGMWRAGIERAADESK